MAAPLAIQSHPRAEAALAASVVGELRGLRVENHDGGLLLSGSVSSFYHKQLAQEVVRAVCREVEIINAIQVSDAATDE